MGRIFYDISVNGAELYTIFDSGSENNYITQKAVVKAKLQMIALRKSLHVGLGGKHQTIDKRITLDGEIDDNYFDLYAYVIPGLGIDKKNGKQIDMLFGAHDIQRWNIKLDMQNEKLDLSQFIKEFIEFFNIENNRN